MKDNSMPVDFALFSKVLMYELCSPSTLTKYEKKWFLESVQSELWKSDFWKPVFYKVLNRHSYQKEFYLLGSEPTIREVDLYLHKSFKKLEGKYKVACRRRTKKGSVELSLGVGYVASHSRKRQMASTSELVVLINSKEISVMLLPYSAMVGTFYLDEYVVVESIIYDLCKEIFSSPAKALIDFQNYQMKIEADAKALNLRLIEIARASINSLCEKSAEVEKERYNGFLYSIIKINGREECILHKDFLDNPQLLIAKLQKK